MADTTVIDDEVQAERDAKLQKMASSGGGRLTDNVRADYFGAPAEHKVLLPDGISYVLHRGFNEGAKRKYLNAVNRDVKLDRVNKTASIKLASGDDRYQLLKLTICGWDIEKDGEAFPFSPRNLDVFLEQASPSIIDIIEKDVREHNAWLEGDESIEDLEAQRDAIDERVAELKKSAEGK